MNWTGISSPDGSFTTPWSCMARASVRPKNRHANMTGTGFHLPKIRAASAMNPRPAVIPRVNKDDCPIERYAPPAAANTPERITARYRSFTTFTPAESAAPGFSPTARRRKPKGVLKSTYQQIGTSRNAKTAANEMSLRNGQGRNGNTFDRGGNWYAMSICCVEPAES